MDSKRRAKSRRVDMSHITAYQPPTRAPAPPQSRDGHKNLSWGEMMEPPRPTALESSPAHVAASHNPNGPTNERYRNLARRTAPFDKSFRELARMMKRRHHLTRKTYGGNEQPPQLRPKPADAPVPAPPQRHAGSPALFAGTPHTSSQPACPQSVATVVAPASLPWNPSKALFVPAAHSSPGPGSVSGAVPTSARWNAKSRPPYGWMRGAASSSMAPPVPSQASVPDHHEPRNAGAPAVLPQPLFGSIHMPAIRHHAHPASGIGHNFHSAPYPLSLLPFKSWEALPRNITDGAVCASCQKPQTFSPQQRKLFLIAERLSWLNGPISNEQRTRNEEALWAVNAELGIFEPAVEDEMIVRGGRRSLGNRWFPFHNELEAEAAMTIVFKAEVLTDRSWPLWKRLMDDALKDAPEIETGQIKSESSGRPPLGEINGNSHWLPSDTHKTKVKGKELAIIEAVDLSENSGPVVALPKSVSVTFEAAASVLPSKSKIQTLQDFYATLDKLERTSPMGARFLEAYAERLRDEVCKPCWMKYNTLPEGESRADHHIVAVLSA